jgi:hypothetical protein
MQKTLENSREFFDQLTGIASQKVFTERDVLQILLAGILPTLLCAILKKTAKDFILHLCTSLFCFLAIYFLSTLRVHNVLKNHKTTTKISLNCHYRRRTQSKYITYIKAITKQPFKVVSSSRSHAYKFLSQQFYIGYGQRKRQNYYVFINNPANSKLLIDNRRCNTRLNITCLPSK